MGMVTYVLAVALTAFQLYWGLSLEPDLSVWDTKATQAFVLVVLRMATTEATSELADTALKLWIHWGFIGAYMHQWT